MLTGELRNKVDAIWTTLWTEGSTNPLTNIEQITYLLFMKGLDQLQMQREDDANILGLEFKSIFPEDKANYRWHVFKNIGSATEMFELMQREIFPFIKNLQGDEGDTSFSRYMKEANFQINKPQTLQKVVSAIDELPTEDNDIKGDIYEYLLSKLQTSGTNGQFRTPRHIIKMMVDLVKPNSEDYICDPACGKSTLFKLLLNQEVYKGKISKSVDFIKFPPNISDTSKLGIELYKELISDEEEWKLFKELNLLNVDENLLYRKFETLSKGEQTKILLAILFIKEDGFLLIDEPTNHLDMNGRKVVSEYLKSKKGFLLISHDRDFLDGCINHVISINRNSIDVQSGNFTSWYENKVMKDQFEISQNEKLRKDIKRLKEAARQSQIWSDKIENTKNGVKVSGVKPDKGHIGHQSAKMMKKSKNLENRQNKAIEEKQSLLKDIETKENLLLHPLRHHKNSLISVSNLSSIYGERQILSNVSFEIKQGDIVAIYGQNGSGKSTLIKILLGLHHEYIGEIKSASDLEISYIPQDTSNLTGSLNEYIHKQGVDETLCKTILRKLDFARELFEMDMKNYSDGQKKKVLIAVSLSMPAHIFVWDEPMNYIDVISRIQIEEIIKEAKPTLIFVEHDKRFVEDIANKIIQL